MIPIPIPDLASTLQGVDLAIKLYDVLQPRFAKIVESKSDRYLNYDPAFLLDAYAAEQPIAQGLTYTQVCDFGDLVPLDRAWDDSVVRIKVRKGVFNRRAGTSQWQKTSASAFATRVKAGRTRFNEPCIRVTSIKCSACTVDITVQRASYHDQAFTNLVLDFDRKAPSSFVSLRTQLAAQYGDCLPPLNDGRLASTLGVAALIFYWGRGNWVPYIVRRVKKIGVFPAALHCTASGVAKWPSEGREPTLYRYATEQMLDELKEEVGLLPEDLLDLRPMAICREMARGGKPQIFYVGLTLLDRKALKIRRAKAQDAIAATTRLQELEKDRWLRSADVVMAPSALRSRVTQWGLTLEGAASFHYGVQYLRRIGTYLK